MVIEFKQGDILTDNSEAIVNTVNCVGFMGRGIALQFKRAYPDNFKQYAAACKRDEVKPGRMLVYETGKLTNPKLIINFPTKRHWRGKSRMEDIDAGLTALVQVIQERQIRSIAIPPLGAGLGGLDWQRVRPRIERALAEVPHVQAAIYEPHVAPMPLSATKAAKAPTMTAGRAAIVRLMHQYLSGLLDPFITLLEVHKLVYFLQESGESLKLRFVPASHGPYAENLRHVLQAIEGYYIDGYGEGGDAPSKPLQLVPGAIDDAVRVLEDKENVKTRFALVADLVDGFESPFGLELLATVHWLMKEEQSTSDDELVERFYAWSFHKRHFSPAQILLARETLSSKGWLR
jgi:O-acetyl-ADP-ribose deacetylase (regulator of RNase III)